MLDLLWPMAKEYADRNIFDDWAPRPSARYHQNLDFFNFLFSWGILDFKQKLNGILLSGLVVSTRPATANFGRRRLRPSDPLISEMSILGSNIKR